MWWEMVKKFHKRRKVTALDTNDDFMIHLSGQAQENCLQYIHNQRKLINRRKGVNILNSKVSKISDNSGLSRIIIRDNCNITRSSHIIGCHLWTEYCTTTCGNYLAEKLLLNIIRLVEHEYWNVCRRCLGISMTSHLWWFH